MIYGGFRVTATPGQALYLAQQVPKFNKLVGKHGGKPVANFVVAVGGQGTNDHVHLFAYKDWAAYGAAGDALQADTEWQQFLAEVGTKVASVSSSVLIPLPESGLQ